MSVCRFLASDMPFSFVNVKDYTDGRAKQIIRKETHNVFSSTF